MFHSLVGNSPIFRVPADVHLPLYLSESIRAPLLKNGHLVPVEELLWVQHVKEVELGVDRDGRLLPRCIRGRPLLYHHLL